MSNVQIPNLPVASALGGTEQLEGVQTGTSVRLSISQIATYVNATYPAPGISSVTATSPLNSTTVSGAVTISLPAGSVTNATLATMANGTVKGNVSGGSASPSDITPSQVLDTFGTNKGIILYRDTSSWAALAAGSNGQVLTAQGSGAAPIWQTLSVPSGSIAPTGVTAGTYGSASTVPQFTVLASGQLSAASNVPITIPSTSVTGLGTMATQNANTVAITGGNIDGTPIGSSTPSTGAFTSLSASGSASLATISSGTWNGTPIAVLYGGTGATTASGARTNLGAAASGANSDITSLSGLTTPLSAPQGGTGFGSYTTGDILVANTSSTLARLNDVATGNALISGGVGVGPTYGKIGLTTHVSGTLPVANGGSGATTLTGFLKGNGTSAFTAQATIGNADLTNSSVTVGSTSIVLGGTATTLGGLTTVTLTQDPTAALEAATKQYVDNEVLSVSNTTFHASSDYATTADLGTVTYSNGTGGVNATITQSGSPSVLIIDGHTFTASDVSNATRVLVKNQSSGLQNGIYTVANEGSGAANWQLIRATDFNTVGTGPNRVQTGASTFVTSGAANGSTGWVMNTDGTIVIGTTNLVWVQSSSSSSVTVTSPLVKVGSVISLGTVPVTLGGTGLTTLTQYGVMLGNGTGNVAFASPGTSGLPLLSTGASSNPAFGQLSLSSAVTGTLPVTNGGTGTATAFTAGSVVFAGASGVYSQENAEFFWDNTNDFLGLGTASPDTRLTITAPTQTSVTAGTLPAGTDLHIVGADSAITRITQDSFGTGNYPAYTGRSARGTAASPTATQAGDVLSQYGGRGHGATAYSSSSVARIDLEAAENFTDTAQGSFISFHTTALGTASQNERFRVGPAGQWGIGGANYGTSGQVFTSGGASAAPSWTTLSATSLTGVLPVANGGTNISSYTVGDLLYADGATSLAKLADVATGNALISGGIGVAPSYGKIGLSTHVSGTLPIGSGGTGVTGTPVNGELLIGNGTGYSLGTLTASTGISVTNGSGTITIANTGVTSLTAGTNITVSAATGGVTIGTTATPTWTSETVPLISGGTSASSTLTLQSTSGAGTSDAIIFRTASQTERMRINTSGDVIISANSADAALRITQTSTGNALLVEDTTNPDASPFVIDTSGRVNVGSLNWYASGGITPSQQFNGTGQGASLALNAWQTGTSVAARLIFNRGDSSTVGDFTDAVDSGDQLGLISFAGSDGVAFIDAASIEARVDGTPGTNDMPGRLVFSTTADGASTPTERMRIDSAGRVGFNSASLGGASGHYRFSGNISGAASSSGVLYTPTFQSDVTTGATVFSASPSTQDAAFTVGVLTHFSANQGTITGGSRLAPTNQIAFHAQNTLTGATNNYGFYGNIPAGTGDWNFYAAGTADNYFAGQVQLGAGTVSAPALSTTGDTNTGIFFPAADTIAFAEGGVESMRIDSSGNVGIANTSPSTRLDVTGPASVTSFTGTTSLGVTVRGATSTNDFSGIDFRNSSASSGSVPVARIGMIATTGGSQLYFGTSSSYVSGVNVTAMTLDQSGNLVATGNVTAYSDARLKKNVTTIDNALELVEKMRGVRYERIDSGKAGVGVIAQEMQEIVPEVVHEGENLSVAYGNLVGVLIEAVKELSGEVKELSARVKELEAK